MNTIENNDSYSREWRDNDEGGCGVVLLWAGWWWGAFVMWVKAKS